MHLHLCNHFRKSLAFLSTVGSSGNSRRYTGRITQPLCMVSYNRIGKRNYIWMKSFGVAFTGGAISVSAAGIALVVFIVICRNIPTLNTLQNISEVISITGIGFIRLFLNGALWSLCGSLTAVLTKNKYLSCAVPFILYYVLTVFQERYYRNYFFLSPKQWASPAYYGNGFCLLALLLISSLLALALRKCVVRRVVA